MHARGNVEMWLGDLLVMQQKSLHAVIREAYQMINDQAFDLLAFFNDYIAQVCTFPIHLRNTLPFLFPGIYL